MAFILSAAVPWPPLMMAPAWPCGVRRRGLPGDKTHHRLLHIFLHKLRRGLLGRAPISPIMMMASVSASSFSSRNASMCVVPIMGSPPMPIAVDCRCRAA